MYMYTCMYVESSYYCNHSPSGFRDPAHMGIYTEIKLLSAL
jgi:hypothetical protein